MNAGNPVSGLFAQYMSRTRRPMEVRRKPLLPAGDGLAESVRRFGKDWMMDGWDVARGFIGEALT